MADEPQRRRIEVACPECGHRQTEPALVISTQCRSCRAHYQVRAGKGVAKHVAAAKPTTPRKASTTASPANRPKRSASLRTTLRLWLLRLVRRRKPPREVICSDCRHAFPAVAEAQSSQCPKCGTYASLLDHTIRDPWNRRIQTRGNIVIHKKGSVSGTCLQCHHLTVIGQLAASAECSGDLVIRSHGRITGTIRCRHLRVEKGARVEFLHPVVADSASIAGHVRGAISCSGPVTLERRASFHGLVRTPSLVTRPGAIHEGTLEILEPPA